MISNFLPAVNVSITCLSKKCELGPTNVHVREELQCIFKMTCNPILPGVFIGTI